MSDLRLWSRPLIAELIEMYKSFPCLWKVRSEGYTNKYIKAGAYRQLVQFCKKKGFHEATRDFVVRKIQSLRGSFRKELRKSLEYQKRGEVYTSTLWYYNNLLFTKGQECPSSGAIDQEDLDRSDEEFNQSASEAEDNVDEDEVEEVETKFSENKAFQDLPGTEIATRPEKSPQTPAKRKRSSIDYVQPEFLNIPTPDYQTNPIKNDLSEFDVIGINISKKLARMDTTQAIYAESIINNVIRRGLLKKLTEDTDVCDNLCRNRLVSSAPSQSMLGDRFSTSNVQTVT